MDAPGAIAAWHWPFLAQPGEIAEPVVAAAKDIIVASFLRRWAGRPDALNAAAISTYLAQFDKPEVIAATCADYRAGVTLEA